MGVEGDLSLSSIKGSKSITESDIGLRGTIDDFDTARIRFGYAVGQVMPYVTANALFASMKVTATSQSLFGDYQPSVRAMETGWTAGGGFEYALTENLSPKAEYLYGRLPMNFSYENASIPVLAHASAAGSFNIVRIGLNYKFL